MSDDHAAHAIGAYGGRLSVLNPTPVLDELANNGVLFENAFCTNSICTPSRATILTGQYSNINGVLDLDIPLKPENQYLPEELKKLGYETAIIGKWHLHSTPAFDYYKILYEKGGQGTYFNPRFIESGIPYPENGTQPAKFHEYPGHSTDVITDQTIDWLKNKRNKNKPFFLMHQYKAPHDMFEYAPRYESYLVNEEIPEPENLYHQPFFGSEAIRGRNDSLIHRIGTSVSDRHYVRSYTKDFNIDASLPDSVRTRLAYQLYLKKYLRCVKGVDDNLLRLFSWLKENGLWENTIVIYTSDQGMMLGEHDLIDKRWMYDESMQIPLIVHFPEKMRIHKQISQLINNTDIAPFIIDLAGGTAPEKMQGKSFLPLITGQNKTEWRNATYYRYWMHLIHHDIPAHFGLRTENYKLIFYYGQHYNPAEYGNKTMSWLPNSNLIEITPAAWEFYDLKVDPEENINQYKNPAYSTIIETLKNELKEIRIEINDTDEEFPEIFKKINLNWN